MPSFNTLVGSAALLLSVLPAFVLGSVVKRELTVPVPLPTPIFPPENNNEENQSDAQFECSVLGVTEYFSRDVPVPEECLDYYTLQIREFCTQFLAVEKKVYTATVTPEATQTSTVVVATTVKPAAAIAKRDMSPRAAANDDDEDEAPPGCRDLTQDRSFARHPEFLVRTACRCFPILPYTTVYLVSTAPAPVKTVTSTKTVTETS